MPQFVFISILHKLYININALLYQFMINFKLI